MQDEHKMLMRLVYLEALVQRLSENYNDLAQSYSELATKFNAHTHTYNPALATTSATTSGQNQGSATTTFVVANVDFTLNRLP